MLTYRESPLRVALPDLLHTPRDAGLGWQAGAAGLLCQEARTPGPGSEAVLTHLAGLLAIGAVRQWLAEADPDQGFGRALHTPELRRALDAIHADPTTPWTLADLARTAGMSRSSFSKAFTDTIGASPMRYTTRWRMSVAREWLVDGTTTVDEAADRLGYRSRAAFSRAYKASTGESPGHTRRRGRPVVRTLNQHITADRSAQG